MTLALPSPIAPTQIRSMTTRRDFLTTLGVTLGAASLGRARALGAEDVARHLPRIGIQLYTLRSLMAKDVEGTLAQVAGIATADMIFFAMDATRARAMRPYLGKALPSYGTSQIYAGASDAVGMHDLNGVTFVDMPWVLMPDHQRVRAMLDET